VPEPASPRIRVLPPDLVNQIAAGEVVERPASAVKELVENALDAEATRIDVALRGSGTEEILVRDDGTGMSREEAALALVRHATSKLAAEEDLRRIATFGFRGEALPAIAAVSRLRLLTRRPDDAEGTEVLVEGGEDPVVRPAGAPPGTTVVVRDLFHRTPARRKFLKSPRTELAACVRAVEWLALSNPGVGFTVHHDDRQLRRFLPQSSAGDRVREVLPDVPLHGIAGSIEGVSVLAFLAPPGHARPGARNLEILVNGRRVNDRSVVAAVLAAYEGTIEHRATPPGVVYLNLAPSAVDVNVHPRKEEVRFVNPRQVYAAVLHVLRGGLARPAVRPFPSPPAYVPAVRLPGAAQGSLAVDAPPAAPFDLPPLRPWSPPPVRPITPEPEALDGPGAAAGAAPPAVVVPRPGFFASLVPAGQVFLTYLICEAEDRIVLIDQHAAHERVVYEDLRGALRGAGIPSQGLLDALSVPLPAELLAVLEDEADALRRLGFEAEAFGPDRALLRAHPAALRGEPSAALRETLAALAHGRGAERSVLERGLAAVACHSAIRAGKRVSEAEVQALLVRMDEVDFGSWCPHGRPAWTTITRVELERMFGRR
jgi:DNA mismatch repair protein MutL